MEAEIISVQITGYYATLGVACLRGWKDIFRFAFDFFYFGGVWSGDGPNFYPTLSLLVVPLFTVRRRRRRTRSTRVY